jgi:sulfur carrier protein
MAKNSDRRISITLNGEPYALDTGTSVAALVEALKMRPARVAVEVNREVVPKAQYAATEIRAGDQVEIINFVGGG